MTSRPFPDRTQTHMRSTIRSPSPRRDSLARDDPVRESHAKALQLPIELWLQVFELLDRRVLSRIALTCKVFRRFSTPLLERELLLDLPRQSRTWKAPEKADGLSVRSVVVEGSATDGPTVLLVPFFRFLNLRSLTFRRCRHLWDHLWLLRNTLPPHPESLHHLTSLALIDCDPDFMQGWPSLPLSHIQVVHLCAMDWVWCLLLSPAHLTHLSVPMRMKFREIPPLPLLRFLHVYGGAKLGPRWERFLSSGGCPGLETFEMEPDAPDVDYSVAVTPRIQFDLPKLRSYRGPDVYAPMFAWTASLVHASLWRAPKDNITITTILSQLCQLAPALKTLHLCTLRIGTPTIDAIGGFCALEKLVIHLEAKHLVRKVMILL
jgi:hypothetical protein